MTELERAIQAIEHGLLRATHSGERPAKKNEGFHSIMIGCPEAGQGIVWMINGENGRRLGWEASRDLAQVVRWSWW